MSNEYAVVTEKQKIYGPFTKEEADREAETMRNQLTNELPYLTNNEVIIRRIKEIKESRKINSNVPISFLDILSLMTEEEIAIFLAKKCADEAKKLFNIY